MSTLIDLSPFICQAICLSPALFSFWGVLSHSPFSQLSSLLQSSTQISIFIQHSLVLKCCWILCIFIIMAVLFSVTVLAPLDYKALCVLIFWFTTNKQKNLKLYASGPLLGACRFVQASLCPLHAYPVSGPLWTLPYFTSLFCTAIWEACPARKENAKQVNGSSKMGIYYRCIKEVSLFELDSCSSASPEWHNSGVKEGKIWTCKGGVWTAECRDPRDVQLQWWDSAWDILEASQRYITYLLVTILKKQPVKNYTEMLCWFWQERTWFRRRRIVPRFPNRPQSLKPKFINWWGKRFNNFLTDPIN